MLFNKRLALSCCACCLEFPSPINCFDPSMMTEILKILLPERQINKKIYLSFDRLLEQFNYGDWIKLYIFWELSLIKVFF